VRVCSLHNVCTQIIGASSFSVFTARLYTVHRCIQCECVHCTTFVHRSSVHPVRVCSLHNVCTQIIGASSVSVFTAQRLYTVHQSIQCECVDCTKFVHSSSVHPVRVCSLHNVCTQIIGASSASVFTAQRLYTDHQCIQCECFHCTTFVHSSSVHPVRVC